MTMADGIVIAISIISLVCSVFLTQVQLHASKVSNRTNLEAEYFKELYSHILVYDIPKGREYIHYDGNTVSGLELLIDSISKIRRCSLYFKSNHLNYYNKLVDECQKLEDILVETDSGRQITSTGFHNFMTDIESRIDLIYEHISAEYIGK
jgi:hypothetical protein